ncbi:hypothetical protein SS17_3016 [Escherichia coli O157:H7 str. SS17]|nr:hypothetical protein SS17_3016 [Escherichia coli O157:H7 str. SS17]
MNRLFSFIILLRSFHELSHILPLAQGARRGRTIASSPCTPGLWRTKSPLRGTFSLSPSATGSGARKRPCKTRPQPTSMWLPRPSGNASAILTPPTPELFANQVHKISSS